MVKSRKITKSSITYMVVLLTFIALLIFIAPSGIKAYAESEIVEYATGCLPDDGTIPSSFSVLPQTRSTSMVANLPVSKDLSANGAFPVIGNQGDYGSCVAYATTYYQFTYQVARLNGWNVRSDTSKVFSPIFVYNYVNSGSLDNGTSITECYPVLAELGAVRRYEFNESANSLCAWNGKSKWFEISNGDATHTARELTVASLNRALENRVTSWNSVQFSTQNETTTAPVITPSNLSCIDVIKNAIVSDHVLVFRLSNSYSLQRKLEYNASNVAYVAKFENRGSWQGHALTIVGYNDNMYFDLNKNGIAESFEYGALKVANSWGSTWGTNGYFWLPYDALNLVSNDESLNTADRMVPLYNNSFYYIDVANYSPELTVEVDVTLNDRVDCHMKLNRGISSNTDNYAATMFAGKISLGAYDANDDYIPTDFNGNTGDSIEYDTRVFVFDLSNPYYDTKPLLSSGTLFDETESSVYFLEISDSDADDEGTITVERIEWKEENGDSMFVGEPADILDGVTKNYFFGGYYIDVSSVNMNQDARRVHINIEFANSPTTIVVHIGNRSYSITRPIGTNVLEQTINGDRVKLVRSTLGGSATWDIQIELSQATPIGTTENFYVEYKRGSDYIPSILYTDFVAYSSYVKTGLTEGMLLEELIDDINGNAAGFTYSVVNGVTFDEIAYTSTTKAGTGMIVLKKYNGKIAEAYFIVLYGDISGGGTIGDGAILVDDALAALRHVGGTGPITEEFFLIAADIDHDGDIDSADSQAILNDSAQSTTIDQSYVITDIPDGLYYMSEVEFN